MVVTGCNERDEEYVEGRGNFGYISVFMYIILYYLREKPLQGCLIHTEEKYPGGGDSLR